MESDVPQGSVLGPLLWDIGFDRVLRTSLPNGCHVVCYGDDTLVVADGGNWDEARFRAEVAVASVVRTIGDLGLMVAPLKTQTLLASAVVKRQLRQALRPLMIRAIRGIRTVSYMAATTLAGSSPVELLAEERRILYWRVKQLREGGELTARDLKGLMTQARDRTQERLCNIFKKYVEILVSIFISISILTIKYRHKNIPLRIRRSRQTVRDSESTRSATRRALARMVKRSR
ncbi:uncharacterized protein LOC112590255 [Harpegnathos saltator]|uniref:uncharacterized protein LOC112590255 n=1 Tax=Harpegnathos saltator TaxID=610380 RepID=UPI000DBED192|nr:uncharacterized protein LOC112590255 [Harpegnathos saltator]